MRRIQEVLQNMDINTLTPVEALLKLNELKGIVAQYCVEAGCIPSLRNT